MLLVSSVLVDSTPLEPKGNGRIFTYSSAVAESRGPTSQGETSKGPGHFKGRPIGPIGPREFKEGPGASSRALRGNEGMLGETCSQPLSGFMHLGEFRS